MATGIPSDRQQEIVDELDLASRYFLRLAAELKRDEICPLPGDERDMALHIFESIELLQWRMEAFSHKVDEVLPQRPIIQQFVPQPALIQQPTNGAVHHKSD